MPETKEYSFLHTLLTSPGYRIVRHILLLLALLVISFNLLLFTYRENTSLLGDHIYWIGTVMFGSYLLVFYLNLYILVPHLLLKKRYLNYILLLSASMILLLTVQLLLEYFTCSFFGIPHKRSSYFNVVTLLDSASNFMMTIICISGGSMTILLKHWMVENRRVAELENHRIQTEVEQLKEQVNPLLLFNVLNKAGVLAKIAPQKASDILLRLSQLLRYQLYDCSRKHVLLDAEIKFLTTYLTLEQLYSGKFDFTVSTDGNTTGVFVPPLLFIPFVRYTVQQINDTDGHSDICLKIAMGGDNINFTCNCCNQNISLADFHSIRQRLDFLYKDKYILSAAEHTINLQLLAGES